MRGDVLAGVLSTEVLLAGAVLAGAVLAGAVLAAAMLVLLAVLAVTVLAVAVLGGGAGFGDVLAGVLSAARCWRVAAEESPPAGTRYWRLPGGCGAGGGGAGGAGGAGGGGAGGATVACWAAISEIRRVGGCRWGTPKLMWGTQHPPSFGRKANTLPANRRFN